MFGMSVQEKIANVFRVLQKQSHKTARNKGFYETDRPDAVAIALMHSELSECLEALRHSNPEDEHCPRFSNAEIELADCIIRILDLAEHKGYSLGYSIVAKMEYNESRPHKHGKRF